MGAPDVLARGSTAERANEKRLSTLQARAALVGARLLQLADGTYLLAGPQGWGREFEDLAGVEAHLNRIGAPR